MKPRLRAWRKTSIELSLAVRVRIVLREIALLQRNRIGAVKHSGLVDKFVFAARSSAERAFDREYESRRAKAQRVPRPNMRRIYARRSRPRYYHPVEYSPPHLVAYFHSNWHGRIVRGRSHKISISRPRRRKFAVAEIASSKKSRYDYRRNNRVILLCRCEKKKSTVAISKKHEIDISLRQYFENIYTRRRRKVLSIDINVVAFEFRIVRRNTDQNRTIKIRRTKLKSNI